MNSHRVFFRRFTVLEYFFFFCWRCLFPKETMNRTCLLVVKFSLIVLVFLFSLIVLVFLFTLEGLAGALRHKLLFILHGWASALVGRGRQGGHVGGRWAIWDPGGGGIAATSLRFQVFRVCVTDWIRDYRPCSGEKITGFRDVFMLLVEKTLSTGGFEAKPPAHALGAAFTFFSFDFKERYWCGSGLFQGPG